MKITVIPARRLTPEHVAAWSRIQEGAPALSSPFLRPEFTTVVAGVRDDVYVAILEQDGRATGFFPHQRTRFGVGRPVGAELNELQGVIVEPRQEWDLLELIRKCGLIEWRFNRLLASQAPFESFHLRRHTSLFIDLSRGYAAYLDEKRRALEPHARGRKKEKIARRIARDVGPLRFEWHTGDANVLAAVMKWKHDRFAAHGYCDLFSIPWARRVIEAVHAMQTDGFRGVLSALYAGDDLVAAHFGIRSRTTLHSWQTAYAPRFARYSPGLLLHLALAEHASGAGLQSIDIGGGDYLYKQRLMNMSIPLAEGAVSRLPLITGARRLRRSCESALRQSPLLHPPARALNRALRGIKQLLG